MLWSVCQRYNLKAIHNHSRKSSRVNRVVIGMSKIQSESNSQPVCSPAKTARCCDRYVKDTIWKQFTTEKYGNKRGSKLWSVCQRYNLKAIHNLAETPQGVLTVVIGMSKIQSESNSQPEGSRKVRIQCCDRYVKDTIWKQFTTKDTYKSDIAELWSVCQRYNLKAIHNGYGYLYNWYAVVIGMSKIQSESNSQLMFWAC